MRPLKRLLRWTPLLLLFLVLLFASPTIAKGDVLTQAAPTRAPITLTPVPTPPKEADTTGPLTSPSSGDSRVDMALVVDKTEAHPGDLLHYHIQVANVAGKVATNVWVTCDLPEGVQVTEVSTTQGEIHDYGQRISIELGAFPAAFESQFVEIKARIQDSLAPGTELVHHANLTSDQAGGGERDVKTTYQVKTVVLDPGTEPTKAGEKESALPVTGSSTISLWVIVGFGVLIAMAALYGDRGRITQEE